MTWVKQALEALGQGKPARVRPLGGSMRGRIESGQLVTIAPASAAQVAVGDAIFVKWKGGYLLHLVVEHQGDRVLIGNNLGRVNGWAPARDVLGRVIAVDP